MTGRVFIGDDVYIENEYSECICRESAIEESPVVNLRQTLGSDIPAREMAIVPVNLIKQCAASLS
jgi:hypothetical protein